MHHFLSIRTFKRHGGRIRWWVPNSIQSEPVRQPEYCFRVVEHWNGFQPMLVQQVDEPIDLVALTQVCMVGKKKYLRKQTADPPTVERALQRGGTAIGELAAAEPTFEGEGDVRCGNLVDVLPAASLADGEYVFEARLKDERDGTPRTVRFSVGNTPDRLP